MKLTEGQLRLIVVACGLLLILFGATKGLFHYDLGADVERWINTGLFCGAAVAFLYMVRTRREAEAQRKREQAEKLEQLGGRDEAAKKD